MLVRRDDPLAQKPCLEREDLLSRPLIMPRREIVRDHIAGWFGVEQSQLNIFSSHSLINNAALLVEEGLGCVVCTGGCFEIRGGENLTFVPFSPKRTSGHVLAWKKNRMFHSAADRFREYVRETEVKE